MITTNRAAVRIIRFIAALFILFGLVTLNNKGKQPCHFLSLYLLLGGSLIIIALMIRDIVSMTKNKKISS